LVIRCENSKYASEYPENVVVKELPRFNAVGKEAYQMLENWRLCFESFSFTFRLDEFYFDNYAKDGNSILRPIHYPPITSEPANAIRAAAHGDINLITLLMGAQGKGLQVQTTKANGWTMPLQEP
jgi:isopenicillin N synthase-like dioxygenase